METLGEEQHSEQDREGNVEVVSKYGEREERFCDEEPHSIVKTLVIVSIMLLESGSCVGSSHFNLHGTQLAKEYLLPETTDKNRAKDGEVCENLFGVVFNKAIV